MDTNPETAQQRFQRRYITSPEVCAELNVTRAAVLRARRTGCLPDPVSINDTLFLWERDAVTPYLNHWRLKLRRMRSRGEAVLA